VLTYCISRRTDRRIPQQDKGYLVTELHLTPISASSIGPRLSSIGSSNGARPPGRAHVGITGQSPILNATPRILGRCNLMLKLSTHGRSSDLSRCDPRGSAQRCRASCSKLVHVFGARRRLKVSETRGISLSIEYRERRPWAILQRVASKSLARGNRADGGLQLSFNMRGCEDPWLSWILSDQMRDTRCGSERSVFK